MTPTLEIGEFYGEADAHRTTDVQRGDITISITENFWRNTNRFEDAPDEWAVTAYLQIAESCSTKQEVMANAKHIGKVIGTLGALDYDLFSVEEPGVTIWHKPAWRSDDG